MKMHCHGMDRVTTICRNMDGHSTGEDRFWSYSPDQRCRACEDKLILKEKLLGVAE
jgi:hypothetical protein